MTLKEFRSQFMLFATAFFLVFLFYNVCVDIPFAHHDSLRYFGKFFQPASYDTTRDPYYPYSWTIGRPVCAELENLIYQKANGFAGLSGARFICVVLVALLACMFVMCFRYRFPEGRNLVLLGVWLVVLPGLQHNVFMLAPHYTLAAIFAVAAYMVWTSGLSATRRGMLTVALLLSSLLSYAAVAFLFLALLAAQVLWTPDDKWGKTFHRIIMGIVLLGACSALYWGINKILLMPRFPVAAQSGYQAYKLQPALGTVFSKLWYLFSEGATYILNPFSPAGGSWAGYLVGSFIILIMAFHRDWDLKGRLTRILVWFLLLLASTFVWTVSGMELFLYRVFYSGMVLCAVSLLWALGVAFRRAGLSRMWGAVYVLAILALAIGLAHQTLTRNVWNANAEMTFVRSQLAKTSGVQLKRVHVIAPVYTGYGFNGYKVMDDDLNMNSSNFDFDFNGLVKMGLWAQYPDAPLRHCWGEQKSCVENAPAGILLLTHSAADEPVFPSENMVVVDFNDMVKSMRVFRQRK